MSVASEIERIQNAKASLKASINAKNNAQHQITDESIEEYMDFVGDIPSLDSLQSKSVTITENTTTNITADSGYNGLSSVSVTTNVSGGDTPTKGLILSDWDNDGYPTKAEIVGMTGIPNSYFQLDASSSNVLKNVTNIKLPNNITSIGWYAFAYSGITGIDLPNTLTTLSPNTFSYCKKLISIVIPNSVNSIGNVCFGNCSNLINVALSNEITAIGTQTFISCSKLENINLENIVTIADYAFQGCGKLNINKINATTIGNSSFASCYAFKKISLPNLISLIGNNSGSASFRYCTGLKQVWIGSSIATNGLQRYAFANITSLEKIYINLPRATVEAMTGYDYAFCNSASKQSIIVCNDDSEFIDEATFDAQVIS